MGTRDRGLSAPCWSDDVPRQTPNAADLPRLLSPRQDRGMRRPAKEYRYLTARGMSVGTRNVTYNSSDPSRRWTYGSPKWKAICSTDWKIQMICSSWLGAHLKM